MENIRIGVFVLLFLLTKNIDSKEIKNTSKISSVGILDDLIKRILDGIRPNLANLHIPYENFETGPQEIGMLNGSFREVLVQGLDKFYVKIINTTLFDINNLTIVEENFIAKGLYSVNGTLAFPLGKKDIHFHGNGEFCAELTGFSVSMKLKIRYESGNKIVRDFDLDVGLEKLKIHLKNLMNGGDLEKVFNKLLNDVGLTVFNYYRQPLLNAIKPEIVKFITEMLNTDQNTEVAQFISVECGREFWADSHSTGLSLTQTG